MGDTHVFSTAKHHFSLRALDDGGSIMSLRGERRELATGDFSRVVSLCGLNQSKDGGRGEASAPTRIGFKKRTAATELSREHMGLRGACGKVARRLLDGVVNVASTVSI
eukprot:GHVU01024683.1.p7 GENE.GHVU01024683.1~~GHVU01024683.1.p7  ORF type:complete len:109 (-),score=14.17 GHVU01024683.1:1113-1439(-)